MNNKQKEHERTCQTFSCLAVWILIFSDLLENYHQSLSKRPVDGSIGRPGRAHDRSDLWLRHRLHGGHQGSELGVCRGQGKCHLGQQKAAARHDHMEVEGGLVISLSGYWLLIVVYYYENIVKMNKPKANP